MDLMEMACFYVYKTFISIIIFLKIILGFRNKQVAWFRTCNLLIKNYSCIVIAGACDKIKLGLAC